MSPWKPLPTGPPEPRSVRESLDALARSLGAPEPTVLGEVFGRWEEIVGPAVAAQCWPLRIRGGVLRIGVEQPAWASQLRFLGPELLRQVAAVTGDASITDIEVKLARRRPC